MSEKHTLTGHALPDSVGHMCNCIGPQNGQPKCPCMMRHVIQRDGRWIEPERDLGPVLDMSNWYKVLHGG